MNRIRYTVNRSDLMKAQFRAIIRHPILRWIGGLMLIAFIYGNMTVPAFAEAGWEVKAMVAMGSVLVFLIVFSLLAVLLAILVVVSRRHRSVLCVHELRMEEQGLVEKTPLNESLHRWESIHRVISKPSHLTIYVTEDMFHLVPKTRPLLEGDWEAFERELGRRLSRK